MQRLCTLDSFGTCYTRTTSNILKKSRIIYKLFSFLFHPWTLPLTSLAASLWHSLWLASQPTWRGRKLAVPGTQPSFPQAAAKASKLVLELILDTIASKIPQYQNWQNSQFIRPMCCQCQWILTSEIECFYWFSLGERSEVDVPTPTL